MFYKQIVRLPLLVVTVYCLIVELMEIYMLAGNALSPLVNFCLFSNMTFSYLYVVWFLAAIRHIMNSSGTQKVR